MDVDLLINPQAAGIANLETVDLPTLTFDDVPAPAPGPKLVPSSEDTGPVQMGGTMNFNAEPYAPSVAPRKMSDEALMKEKYEVLRKFERLSKMGVPMRKRFTMDSPLDEMKLELEFIKREKNMDATIKQFSEWFVTAMSGLEYGSKHVTLLKAFGLQLDGLSESAQMNVVDLEDDFEELYDLYGENLNEKPVGGRQDRTYAVWGKPAEATLRKYFREPIWDRHLPPREEDIHEAVVQSLVSWHRKVRDYEDAELPPWVLEWEASNPGDAAEALAIIRKEPVPALRIPKGKER